jgi:endonuclease/exonuclease/phosphatase family metal-dependent hydrolase
VFLGVTLLAACDGATPIGTTPSAPANEPDGETIVSSDDWYASWHNVAAPIRIYQQNVYVGTDVDAVIATGASSSDPAVLFGALIGALQTFDATDWPARANRMADEIKRQGPDVISLNEISTVTRRGLANYGVADNSTDFLPVFMSALAARRLDYRLVGQVKNTEVIIPLSIDPVTGEVVSGPDGYPAAFASLTDYDVLLARRGVTVGNVTAKNYQAYLPVNLGSIPVAIKRGYVGADLTIFGQAFRVVSTHPEPRTPVKEIQEAQVAELLQDLSTTTLPVVVAGDFNSQPNDPANSPWDQMTRAGFTDLWTARIGRPEQGATCCHAPDLRDATSRLDRRLDYVWIKADAQRRVGPVVMTVFGDEAKERTASGLWPSDHGGLFGGAVLLARQLGRSCAVSFP